MELGDAGSEAGDAGSEVCDARSVIGDVDSEAGDAGSDVGDAGSELSDDDGMTILQSFTIVGATEPMDIAEVIDYVEMQPSCPYSPLHIEIPPLEDPEVILANAAEDWELSQINYVNNKRLGWILVKNAYLCLNFGTFRQLV